MGYTNGSSGLTALSETSQKGPEGDRGIGFSLTANFI